MCKRDVLIIAALIIVFAGRFIEFKLCAEEPRIEIVKDTSTVGRYQISVVMNTAGAPKIFRIDTATGRISFKETSYVDSTHFMFEGWKDISN